MAKFYIEQNTANQRAFRSNHGATVWQIGSNWVFTLIDSDPTELIYRNSSDLSAWNEESLYTTPDGNTHIRGVSSWYTDVGGTPILYAVWTEVNLSTSVVKIAKWDLTTITSPSQVGSTVDLTTSHSWSPLYHCTLGMASDEKMWLAGCAYDGGGGPYHEYYTMKATNAATSGDATDINAWGTELLMGDINAGFDKQWGAQCRIIGSEASAKALFVYYAHTTSGNAFLYYRWNDGTGNVAGDWTPTPPAEGTSWGQFDETYVGTTETGWWDSNGLAYCYSSLSGKVWLARLDGSRHMQIRRFDIENTSLDGSDEQGITSTSGGLHALSAVQAVGGYERVHTCAGWTIKHMMYDELLDTWTTSVTLDSAAATSHRRLRMPVGVASSDDDTLLHYSEP